MEYLINRLTGLCVIFWCIMAQIDFEIFPSYYFEMIAKMVGLLALILFGTVGIGIVCFSLGYVIVHGYWPWNN